MLIRTYHLDDLPPLSENAASSCYQDWSASASPLQRNRRYRVTTVIGIDDNEWFLLQQRPSHALILPKATSSNLPIVVMRCDEVKVDSSFIARKLDSFLSSDKDVTCRSLMTTVLLNGVSHEELGEAVLQTLGTYGCEVVFTLSKCVVLDEGPHFYSDAGIFRAIRLRADYQEAFILTTVPSQDDEDHYESLAANIANTHTLAVPIPSRLHSHPSAEKPLAGMRIAVKDLFHLKGVHTGGGNRAYRALYAAQTKSSSTVRLAISKGCIAVGKAKTVEFGGSQESCGDWIDYSYPLNCRGDGYIGATGSSTGSAAALAAYEYLDITIGTDAGGSVRDPATAQGLFGLRPTHDGSVEIEAIVPCQRFQRSGFLARDLVKLGQFVNHAADIPFATRTERGFNRVMFPPDYAIDISAAQTLCKIFAQDLAAFLNTSLDETSFEILWETAKPETIDHGFFEYFDKTFITLLANDYWKDAETFRRDYEQAYSRRPYVCPVTQWLWEFGSTRTADELRQADSRVSQHNEWFTKHVLGLSSHGASLVVTPECYMSRRDEYLPHPARRSWFGFDSNLHASFAGLPSLVVPVGQVPYLSKTSGVVEQLPISVAITTSKGLDSQLIELVLSFLRHQCLPTEVNAGRNTFTTKPINPQHSSQRQQEETDKILHRHDSVQQLRNITRTHSQ
ncbi:hypothetical protein AC579_10514 [Pseudocercospora musae]|uniref:Amidase domain-containing protein n=1 Tax=Pseudocercospora musae TaxID=113226 RepID=A0A139I557_9PEZI|nr:hypothetical protein AC579_10514 [Pseudocercospora musae]